MSIQSNSLLIAVFSLLLLNYVNSQLADVDKSDEDCSSPSEFRCKSGKCIKIADICNDQNNCGIGDNSDEENCDFNLCRGDKWYQCKGGMCVSSAYRCDNQNDCPLGDDEDNCGLNFTIMHVAIPCLAEEFECEDKMCIPRALVCDGLNHCLDGTDETGCNSTKCVGFVCKNQHCLENHDWVCDGVNDCMDNSDEEHCSNTCGTADLKFLCKDNKTCLPIELACNGSPDCPDKSDESSTCKSENTCTDFKCEGKCHLLPTGPECECKKGFKFNKKTKKCEDIDECLIFGICSHSCINYNGTYRCTCANKYTLKSDNTSCEASSTAEPVMLFTTQKSIGSLLLKSQHLSKVVSGLKQVVGVGYDGLHIYWTDISKKTECIVRALEDGSNKETLITAGLESPEDLVVDFLTGNIYFSDSGRQHIAVCSNSGAHCFPLIVEDIHRPRAIALDPTAGIMFWTDWGNNPKIGNAAMDGSMVRDFVTDDIHWPNGLALDQPNGRLYWADAKLKRIESIRINGKDRRRILEDVLKHPYSLEIFENRIFWSDWDTKSVQSCNKFSGKHREILIRDQSVYGIHIYHPALQPRKNHACLSNNCSHVCLLTVKNSYTCACPDSMELSPDKHSCKELGKKHHVVLGATNYILRIEHVRFGKHEDNSIDKIDGFASRIVYNSLSGELFVADNFKKIIYTYNLTSSDLKPLVTDFIGNISSLAFDELGNNLYWADIERGSIEILSLNTMSRAIIQHYSGTDKPVALALLPLRGEMLVVLQSIDHTHIDKQALDGKGEHIHIAEDRLSSKGLFNFAVDDSLEAVFFSDTRGNKIEYLTFDGEFRHLFRANLKSPVNMAVVNETIYWSGQNSKYLYFTNKQNTGKTKKMKVELPSKAAELFTHFQLAAITPIKVLPHICKVKNGGCSHICVSNGPTSRSCLCPTGMTFDSLKNLTCVKRSQCEFKCGSGECLQLSARCNGKIDCGDKSDEADCEDNNKTTCALDEFRCADGKQCIKNDERCDMHINCNDKSDESDCDTYDRLKECHEHQFKCPGENHCLDLIQRCDGSTDCKNGFDELDCGKHRPDLCGDNMFACMNGQCIDKHWECDSYVDCEDSSDEQNCSNVECPRDYFSCGPGECIHQKLVCDQHADCSTLLDEVDCAIKTVQSCAEDEFKCNSSLSCIDFANVCDGEANCNRGEDERNCSGCRPSEFECNDKRCIRLEFRCDQQKDCENGEDEENCSFSLSHDIYAFDSCKDDMFDCKDGTCIDFEKMCDGVKDCQNGKDESALCESSCENHPCEQKCQKTPDGPICGCEEGYILDSNRKNCTDVDECTTLNPCSQICDNLVGSYRCSCFTGFILTHDKISCKAMGAPVFMLFNTFDQIRLWRSRPLAKLSVPLEFNGVKVVDFDVNVQKNQAFFTLKETSGIYKVDLETNKVEVTEETGEPEKMSLDWITGNIYFSDRSAERRAVIRVRNMDKLNSALLVTMENRDSLTSISVDPINKALFYANFRYWIFNEATTVINKANLDGTGSTVLLKNGVHVSSLANDPRKKILYYVDMHEKNIQQINYDGSNKKVLIEQNPELTKPMSISVFENHAYIVNLGSSQAAVCKLYGNLVCKPFNLNVYNSERLIMVQKSNQKQVPNVCDNHKCDIVCVQAELGPKCLCSNGTFSRTGTCGEQLIVKSSSLTSRSIADFADDDLNFWEFLITFLTIFVLLAGVAYGVFYWYRKQYSNGKYSVSMHYHNPKLEEDLSSARSLQFMRAPVVKVGFNTNEVFSDAEGCSMNNYDSVSTTHWQYQKPSDDYFNETLDDHDVKHRLIL